MKSQIKIWDKILDVDCFPNGDLNLKNIKDIENYIIVKSENAIKFKITISASICDSDGIISLALLVDALKNIFILKDVKYNLALLHCPYMQMDRIDESKVSSLSIKVFANIINSMNFNRVTLYGYHSDVTPALINNCITFDTADYFAEIIQSLLDEDLTNLVICAPDAGAIKRAHKFAKMSKISNFISCTKHRDFDTGKLSNITVNKPDFNLEDKTVIIVDDVSVNGGTFAGIAKILKTEYKVHEVILVVMHLINGKPIDYVDNIIATNFYPTENLDMNYVHIA